MTEPFFTVFHLISEQIKVWTAHVRNLQEVGKHLASILMQRMRHYICCMWLHAVLQKQGSGCEQLWPAAVNFWAKDFFQEPPVLLSCYCQSCRHSLCCYYSILVICHYLNELNSWLLMATFFIFDEDKLNVSTMRTDFSALLQILKLMCCLQQFCPKNVHLWSHNSVALIAILLHAAFWSSISWCASHLAVTILLCKV
jgi:hypothetical protein